MDRAKLVEIFPNLVPFAERVGRGIRAVGRGFLWFFRRTWKPALALFIVVFVIHGVAAMVIGRRFAADIAAIKAKGDPVTMAALAGNLVPKEQNGAVVYAKVFKMLYTEPANKDVEILEHLIMKETDSLEQQYVSDRVRNIPDLWSASRLAAQRLEVVVPLVKEAQARPKCKFPVNWEAGTAAILPHYSGLRKLTRVLSAQAVVDAIDGKMAGAFHKIELALKTARAAKDDPILISTLVTASSTRIANNYLRKVLEYGTPDESQARKLYGMLSDMGLRQEFVNAMKGERAMGMWCFNLARKQGMMALGESTSRNKPSAGIGRFVIRSASYAWHPVLYADGRCYLKQMAKSINDSTKSYRLSDLRQLEIEQRSVPRYAVITNILFPVYSRASAAVDGALADTSLTQILVAAQVYKAEIGHYPESINELRAKVRYSIPLDPFSGRDFMYKRTPQGFQVYSIGWNLKDDGGMVPKHDDPNFGDIVLNWKH